MESDFVILYRDRIADTGNIIAWVRYEPIGYSTVFFVKFEFFHPINYSAVEKVHSFTCLLYKFVKYKCWYFQMNRF